MSTHRRHDVERLAADLEHVAHIIRRAAWPALSAARALATDGYKPTASGADTNTTGQGPTVLVDDDNGNPVRIPVTGVELAALARITPDLERRLNHALTHLTTAADTVIVLIGEALTRTPRPDRNHTPHARHCANTHCGELIEGRPNRAGRCEPCATYRDTHDRDAPPKVIRDRRRRREQLRNTNP